MALPFLLLISLLEPLADAFTYHHQSTFLRVSHFRTGGQSSDRRSFKLPSTKTRQLVLNAKDSSISDDDDNEQNNPHPEWIDETTGKHVKPRVYRERWIQLGYLSALALLSDWICFSVAAAPTTYETYFGHSAASLIDIFLFTNVASCFIVTDVVRTFGLKRAIMASSLLMAAGCWLRSGVSVLSLLTGSSAAAAAHVVVPANYPFVVAGTVCVGAAQPFFQCTPPLLSATWFASSERATSTAIALNFNQIGIATAFLIGGAMATDVSGLGRYFALISVVCTLVTIGTWLQFKNEPPIPPSTSELEKKLSGEHEPPFLQSVQRFFATRGFTKALAAFVCSISITNIVGAFIDDVMERGGITNQVQIDLAGAGFELAILFGGILIGEYVDKSKRYKNVTMACLAATVLLVIPLGLTEHAIGKSPILLLASLVGLGFAAGPVQPINAELAVDVTYPGDETAVESVQQIGGNLISALLVPVAELAAKQDYQLLPKITWAASDVRGDVLLLLTVALVTLAYFSTFDAPLLRTMADSENGKDDGDLETSIQDAADQQVVIDTTSQRVPSK